MSRLKVKLEAEMLGAQGGLRDQLKWEKEKTKSLEGEKEMLVSRLEAAEKKIEELKASWQINTTVIDED